MLSKIIVIGASTGGPSHIQKILKDIHDLSGTALVIAQHIGSEYIKTFASQLKNISHFPLHTLDTTSRLEENTIYVASGKNSFTFHHKELTAKHDTVSNHFNPDINYLLHSVATLCKDFKVLSIILTGIGDDGAKGCKAIADAGGLCVSESEESAVIYGMPLRALELNPEMRVAHLNEINGIVEGFVK